MYSAPHTVIHRKGSFMSDPNTISPCSIACQPPTREPEYVACTFPETALGVIAEPATPVSLRIDFQFGDAYTECEPLFRVGVCTID